MNKAQLQQLAENYPLLQTIDGFDDCIIGLCSRHTHTSCLAYDTDKIIKKLQKRDGMTYEQAVEFFEYNIACAYVGKYTPCFVETRF